MPNRPASGQRIVGGWETGINVSLLHVAFHLSRRNVTQSRISGVPVASGRLHRRSVLLRRLAHRRTARPHRRSLRRRVSHKLQLQMTQLSTSVIDYICQFDIGYKELLCKLGIT